MTDIGTGSYTVIAQTAAEMMGVPLDKVLVRLGDSSFPVSCGSGGQWGGNSASSGVYAACLKLREAVAQKAGFNAADAVFADGQVRSGTRSVPLAEVAGDRGLVAEDFIEFGDLGTRFQQSTFGAHFVEVGVDAAHRRNARAPHARRVRGRTHPEPQDRSQPGDRRHGRWAWVPR